MKKFTLLLTMLLLSACSNPDLENTNDVTLRFWDGSEPAGNEEFIKDDGDIETFVSATENAEVLEEGTVINTPPLLKYSLRQDEENLDYHLWISEQGEGYIQSLISEGTRTYQLDEESVESLEDFLAGYDTVTFLNEVTFE
ncbi:hypothetical protein KP77_05070 [Jeotgalibacillus alimentarius]|uniref:YhfM-like domain-containing protein n=1 Tax=Jeotgalibacillus alimentarius TaxID=135826 RepID=A0A0C2WAE1_9BACL|nr:hypothetical protein [Jeotgalibacillus alimentarius]KIL53531.1 hypothetical protein KP77_05070 [Jeotgalibacillus alimentarius]